MTSRRPMARSYSGNGRSGGSYNEEEPSSSNGRLESSNYLSNVRPENRYSQSRSSRSTLLGVMAQLTEDTQPVFETTVKSKAVSENCNVKLTCVVTGNPAPELTWYRDDMELDRYCGLPKYKIGCNGKTHTLHIYNCTVDDAAIYQASARNSKGIVSCSGVLEVGTMSEYKIHQRFFSKLKQKAENKKRELEESRKRGKENIQKEPLEQQPLRRSPIPSQRKRRASSVPSSPPDGKEITVSQGAEAVEQLAPAVEEPNGVSVKASEPAPVKPTENGGKIPNRETREAKKKIKISNGVDSGVVSSSHTGPGSSHTGPGTGENSYDGGISLSQFLADTLHSQSAEEKIPAQVEETLAAETMDTTVADPETDVREEKGSEMEDREWMDRERILGEQEREKMRGGELSIESEKERAREAEQLHRTTAHSNTASEVKMEAKTHAHKEGDHHDHHHMQETLSNVLHSVKYFFFGKSKKDHTSHDHHVKGQESERGHALAPTQPYPSLPHPQEQDGQPEVYKTPTEETVPMEVDGLQKAPITLLPHQQPDSLERLNPDEHERGITISHPEEPPSASKRAPESVPHSLKHVEQRAMDVCLEVISNTTETVPMSGPPALSEAAEDQTQADSVPHMVVSAPHEINIQVFSSGTDQVTRLNDKTEDLHKQGISDSTRNPDPSSGAGPHMSNLTSMDDSESAPNNNVPPTVSQCLIESEKEKEMHVDDKGIESVYKNHEEKKETTIQKAEDISITETDKVKPLKESRIESYIIGDEPRERTPIERLAVKPPTPPRSPSTLRRLMSRTPPAITVDDPANSEKSGLEQSGGDTPTSSLSCESSPKLKRKDSLTLIRSATPEELASGARRKIFIPREGEGVVVALGVGGSPLDTQVKEAAPYLSPSQARRAAFLQAPAGSQTPPLDRRSPLLSRRKATLEVPKVVETNTEEPESPKTEVKPPEKEKLNPFKAPQVIRKIRGEPFPDASGHLKLWCQFFNVLSDSSIKWYRDEEEIVEVKRSGGDESQVALAIVQTSSQDCGVYGCTIKNEFGTDSTDFLLSVDLLSEYFLREDLEVGEEIEMTQMLFTKGLADPGYWGEKFFGRIMTQEAHLGEGCAHKACRVKVIYGLDPVFESGTNCIIKVQNPIAYGTNEDSNLAERNMEITKQECKIQNTVREYCKIFAAEARVIENFGFSLEVSPLYLMYRPANSVPYATVEADLKGIFLKYCMMDAKGRLITRATSEVEMKCCSFQHWIHQWTNGNLLVTGLEGVGPKITKVRIVTKLKGYQGLTEDGSPKVFEQFLTQHQCNYYCGLLSLRTLKPMDTLQQPPKIKVSRSPLLGRKLGSSSPQLNRKLLSSSPQLQRKGLNSPLTTRKPTSSPKVPRKTGETENKSTAKPNADDRLKVVV
ncbi:alpha-protein kinase 3-like [Oncorhynchus masou masou]|uniref:alpha-protein kinase 3-like n=1 Tax=Oncorhynchus masou masou TaxID=90313 RepID=UPI003183CD7B